MRDFKHSKLFCCLKQAVEVQIMKHSVQSFSEADELGRSLTQTVQWQHVAVLDFLVIWVWKSRQSMQRPNEQQQRLSSWAINYDQ